jgi:hypothetical protein
MRKKFVNLSSETIPHHGLSRLMGLETIQTRAGNDLETVGCYARAKSGKRPNKTACSTMMTSSKQPFQLTGGYSAYLVRMWQEHPHSPWRASAQNAQTGEKQVFADLAQLVAFLYAQTQPQPDPPSSPSSLPAER